jgi:hypothetical protein
MACRTIAITTRGRNTGPLHRTAIRGHHRDGPGYITGALDRRGWSAHGWAYPAWTVPRCRAACVQTISVLAAVIAGWLVGACAPTHLVLTTDPQLAGIRTVYVPLFDSLDPHPEAALVMTAALKAQLKADGVFQVVEDPQFADAYFKGTVGRWTWGGLDWQGARSSEISGSLRLLDAEHHPLWIAAAVQRDPLRVVAHGLFARPPSLLAPHWARTVLHQLPGYAVTGRPHPLTGRERRPSPVPQIGEISQPHTSSWPYLPICEWGELREG